MEYRIPGKMRIARDQNSRRLYRLEERRNDVIKQCAIEWIKVASEQFPYIEQMIERCPDDLQKLYKVAMPQQLLDILDSYDLQAAKLAAESFLKLQGYTVSAPPACPPGCSHDHR
jgi:polysaccharide pyruvyl transferase WcaK-like protein